MLYIPTNLVVTKATCDLLRLQVPLYFRANPLLLFLDNVVLHLEEPDVVPPAPCKFAQLWAVDAEEARAPQSEADRRRAKQNMDILYNMTYEVKTLTLLVTTKSNRNTVMRFDVRNTRVESVNRDWLVVDLASSRDIDAANSSETLYKLTRIKSISISVTDPIAGVDTVLADNAPAQYRQTASYNLNTGQLIASRYEFVFERLDFQWDTVRWHLLVDTFSSIGTVFSKEVPINPAAPKAEVYDYHVTYEVFIAEWSMVFDAADVTGSQRRTKQRRRRRESLPTNSNPVVADDDSPPPSPASPTRAAAVVHNGVKLAGVRWKFIWSPQTKKRVKASELDDCDPKLEPANSEIDVHESLVQLTLPSFTCTAIGRPFDSSLRYPALLSRSDATTATKAAAAASFARVQRGSQQVLNMRVLEAFYSQLQSGPRKLTRRPKPVSPTLITSGKMALSNSSTSVIPAVVGDPLELDDVVETPAGGPNNHPHAIRSRHASFQLGKEEGNEDGPDVGDVNGASISARFNSHAGESRPRDDNLPLLAVSFVQRWRASQEKAARTTNELRVVMASMVVAFERTALDRLALFFSAKNVNKPAPTSGRSTPPVPATPPTVAITPPPPAPAATAAPTSPPPALRSEMSAMDARRAFRAEGMQRRSGKQQPPTAAAVAAAKANADAAASPGATPAAAALAPDAGDVWTRMSRRFVSNALPPRRVSEDRLEGVGAADGATPVEEADEAEAEAEGYATWAATTRMYLDIYDTHLVVPDVPGAGHLSNTSIDFAIEHLSVTTRPAWNAVPKLDSELEILQRDTDVVSEIKRDTSTLTSERICFQLRLVGISCVLRLFPHDSTAADSEVTVTPVLEPASIVFYGRYMRKLREGGNNRSRLELMLECSHLNVTVTARQYEYFLFAAQLYAQWSTGMVQRLNQPSARQRVSRDKYARRQDRLQRRGRVNTASALAVSSEDAVGGGDSDDDDGDTTTDTAAAAAVAAIAARKAAVTPPKPAVADTLSVSTASALDRRPSYLNAIGKSARFAFGMSPLQAGRQRQLSISSAAAAAAAAAAAFAVPVTPVRPESPEEEEAGDDDAPPRLSRVNSIDRDALKLMIATRREHAAAQQQQRPPPTPRPAHPTMRIALAVRIDNSVFLVPLSWSSDASLAAQLKPSKVAFSAAQVALDVDDEKRCVVARLAGAEAIGLDHPSLPAYVSLVPRARNTSFFGNQNSYRLLEVRFVRLANEPAAPKTQLPRAHLTVQLRNASLMFVAKTEDSVSVERIVASLRAYATDLLMYFTEHNREVKETLDATRIVVEAEPVAPPVTTSRGAAMTTIELARQQDLSVAIECSELDVLSYNSNALKPGDDDNLERHIPAPSVMPRSRLTLGSGDGPTASERHFNFRGSNPSGRKTDVNDDEDTDGDTTNDEEDDLRRVAADAKLQLVVAESRREEAEHQAHVLKQQLEELEHRASEDSLVLRDALTKIALLQADLDMLRAPPQFAAALYTQPSARPAESATSPPTSSVRGRISTAVTRVRQRTSTGGSGIASETSSEVDEVVSEFEASEASSDDAAPAQGTSRFARMKAKLPTKVVSAAVASSSRIASLKTRMRGGSAVSTTTEPSPPPTSPPRIFALDSTAAASRRPPAPTSETKD
jgi:hypothetical protein